MILDTMGMFDDVAGLPEQLAVADAGARVALDTVSLPAHDGIANVVIAGMGASGQAGELVLEVAGPLMSVPVVVHQGFGVPNFVDPSTLVVAISWSGDTEATLESAQNAYEDGASLFCVSGPGALREFAADTGMPHLAVQPPTSTGRSAIGALTLPVLRMLERVGFFPGADEWIGAAVEQTTRRRDELIREDNDARRLARRLGRTFPIIYGGNGLGGWAAERWKAQFNENAKVAAFANQVPELVYNEVCGWGQDGDVTRQIFQLFMLRHDYEHPRVMEQMSLLDDLLDEVVGAVHTVAASGDGLLAQALDLMLIGDFVSLHSAVEQEVDPGPTPFIDEIEDRIAGR